MSKIGLVLEGGGMKCAYTAGILDAMMDNGVTFDYCIGVSAGSANGVSFVAAAFQYQANLTHCHQSPLFILYHLLFFLFNLFVLRYILT